MAINPGSAFPGAITPPDANYPYGSSQDEVTPGVSGDGTPYNKLRADDIFGFQQALLQAASIVPSGNSDNATASQYLQSVIELSSGRASTYIDNGLSNTDYHVFVPSGGQAISQYFEGLVIRFKAIQNNDGAGQHYLNVQNLGLVPLLQPDLGQLQEGDIVAGKYYDCKYLNGNFILNKTISDDFKISTLANQTGEIKINDIIIKWGSEDISLGPFYTFDEPFPNNGFICLASLESGLMSDNHINTSLDRTTFTLTQSGSGSRFGYWLAIGN